MPLRKLTNKLPPPLPASLPSHHKPRKKGGFTKRSASDVKERRELSSTTCINYCESILKVREVDKVTHLNVIARVAQYIGIAYFCIKMPIYASMYGLSMYGTLYVFCVLVKIEYIYFDSTVIDWCMAKIGPIKSLILALLIVVGVFLGFFMPLKWFFVI